MSEQPVVEDLEIIYEAYCTVCIAADDEYVLCDTDGDCWSCGKCGTTWDIYGTGGERVD